MKKLSYVLIMFLAVSGCDKQAAKPEKKDTKTSLTQEKKSDGSAETNRVATESATNKTNQKAAEKFLKYAQPSSQSAEDNRVNLPIREVDADHITVGQFLVNRKEGWIKIRSKVNQNEEILEYLSCGPRGKLHECVLLSYGLPMHLHLALVLLGAEPGGKYGTDVMIDVEWQDPKTGEMKRHSAARFLYDRLNLRAGQDIVWSFVGSRFMEGQYAANDTQSLVAVINDSEAVIGIKNIVGNAHKGPNQGFEGNKKTTPPPGTPIDLYVRVPQ